MCKVVDFFKYEIILIYKVNIIWYSISNWIEMLLIYVNIKNSVIWIKLGYIL